VKRHENQVDAAPSSGTTPKSAGNVRSWRRPRRVIVGAFQEATTDQVSLAAAGCAFYATMALFPAISVLISVYGLAFNVDAVEQQLQVLRDLLPPPAFMMIEDRVHELVTQPNGTLSIGLVVSLLVAFWSSSTGTKSVISALNVAYNVTERRSFVGFQLIGLLMTLCAVIAATLAIAVLVLLPTIISFVGLSNYNAVLIKALSTAFLVVLVGATMALLYRFGPSRGSGDHAKRRIFPGAVVATALWLVASVGLSFYVSHIASFGATYGPLGAVVAIMLWFYLTAYAVLLGAEVNAQLEHTEQSSRHPDSPMIRSPDT
jgi:membrane protein